MRLIANEIVKLTNLTDKLLLDEGMRVVVVLLAHCFILRPLEFVPLPLLFVPLSQSLFELFNL
jgi:hypothetical protein